MKIRTKEQKTNMSFVSFSAALMLLVVMNLFSTVNAGPAEREQAKRIHDRLTGVPPLDSILNQMEQHIIDGNPKLAADLAMNIGANERAKNFYNVTLKNFVTPWTNVEQTMYAPLNDYTALVIGMVLENRPFNEVLSADYMYIGSGISGLPQYSKTNNDHFEFLENNNVDLTQALTQVPQAGQGMPGASDGKAAGVITTRAAGEAFFKAGTNRRMLRFTLMNYMCRDLEDVKDITRVPDRIRQDVSRSPGGDSSLFLNSCIGCHSGMDPMAGAYAYFEWTENEDGSNGQVVYTAGIVQPKHHINRTSFEFGYVTRNDDWRNYWRKGPNEALGWGGPAPIDANGHASGNGPKSLGVEIASSDAFARCQVEKVYRNVCLQDPISPHDSDITRIKDAFKTTENYSLKYVFAEVAALCRGN